MNEEERIIFIKDRSKLRWVFIISFSILLMVTLMLQKCTDDKYNVLKGQSIELEKVYKQQVDGVAVIKKYRLLELDSLSKEIKIRETHNNLLRKHNDFLKNQIVSIQKENITVHQSMDSLAKFYNTRFKTKNTLVLNNKITLEKSTAQKISGQLQEFDSALKIISLKDKILVNKDLEINNLQKDSKDYKIQLNSISLELQAREDLNITAEKNIEVFKSQVKSLNRKNNINKILLPAAFILGGVTGFQIAK